MGAARPHTPPSAEVEKNRVALTSVGAAVLLTGMKVTVGLSTGSLGILSEAAHSGIDLLAAVMTWWAVRASAKPAGRGTARKPVRKQSKSSPAGRASAKKAVKAARKATTRRKPAGRTREYRQSNRAFGQVGHQRSRAKPRAIGRADHQDGQRLQRHRHIRQRQIDLRRQGQKRRSQRDQNDAAQHPRRRAGALRPQQGGKQEVRRRDGFRHGVGRHGRLPA